MKRSEYEKDVMMWVEDPNYEYQWGDTPFKTMKFTDNK